MSTPTVADVVRSILSMKCWLCQKLCGDHFFNLDASHEIDRLTVENESLRDQLRDLKATHDHRTF